MKLINQLFSKTILKICWIGIFIGCLSYSSFAEDKCYKLNNPNKINSANTGGALDSTQSPVEFINSNFENASPLYWEYNPDGSVLIKLGSVL